MIKEFIQTRKSFLFVAAFLSLIAVMDIPFLMRMVRDRQQTAVVLDYHGQVDEISRDQKEQYLKQAQSYNHSLATGLTMDMELPFADSGEEDPVYRNTLAMDEKGIMAVVEIPKIQVSLPVYHGTSDEVLEEGAGHLQGSSLPVGGDSTHACIAAHRGLPTKRMFTDLDQIEMGDVFFVKVLGETLAYQVYETEVVTPEEIDPLKIENGKDLVTLITCTPYGVNTHRIYVHGMRVPYEEAAETTVQTEQSGFGQNYWWIILTAVLLLWMCGLLIWNKASNISNKKSRGAIW